jgi:hypothetical protein
MNRPSGPRKTASNLSEPVDQHLNMYAIAAVVAVVSVLALPQPSEARIVYTPTNVQVGIRPYNLDLNHDGLTDFMLQQYHQVNRGCLGGRAERAWLTESGTQRNGVVGSGSWPAALSQGRKIEPSRSFVFYANGMALAERGFFWRGGSCIFLRELDGNWVKVSNRYLGVEFQIKGKTHYGWARLSFQVGYVYINATLTGYAYETIPGKAIKAGQTNGSVDAPTGDDPSPTVEDTETLDEKPISDFVLRDPDIPAGFATAPSNPESVCSNCLIRRCLVRNNKLFGGYCLEGARGGICHESYDPAHCPSGRLAKKVVQKQCGPSKFTVDDLRPCQ